MSVLTGEQAARRIQQLAEQRAATLPLSIGSTDGQLEAAILRVLGEIKEDHKLRPLFRQPHTGYISLSDVAAGIITWEVILAAVGERFAEARYKVLRGVAPDIRPDPEMRPITEAILARSATGTQPHIPGAVVADPRRVARRRRRLGPPTVAHPEVLTGLREAVRVEPSSDEDACHELGYDHFVWLEEWLDLAVGPSAFRGLEAAVAGHPDVLAAMHEDRETFFVAAPRLHPEDVRTIVITILAPSFNPDWEKAR